VQATFDVRRAEMMAQRYRDFKYWQSAAEDKAARTELERQRRALDNEANDTLSEI